jgi:hypothetical protein
MAQGGDDSLRSLDAWLEIGKMRSEKRRINTCEKEKL